MLPLYSNNSGNNTLLKDQVYEALLYHNILHPEIVLAQAILETGHFKSVGYTEHNNLFGLYNSKKGEYFKFNHWSESIQAYKDMVEYRYKPHQTYYEFLDRIGYATDPYYIIKLKQIVKQNDYNTRRSSD